MSVFGVKIAAMNLLSDWRKAQEQCQSSRMSVEASTRQWSKPPQGWIKINVDVAIFQSTR